MNKRTFSKYVEQIKKNIVLVEDQQSLSFLSCDSYGNFYDIALNILSEVFSDKKHKRILLEMFDEYKQSQRFRMDYIVNGRAVITPVELYEASKIKDN